MDSSSQFSACTLMSGSAPLGGLRVLPDRHRATFEQAVMAAGLHTHDRVTAAAASIRCFATRLPSVGVRDDESIGP